MQKNPKIYELIIIGGGPAGLTASIYASRYSIKQLIVSNLVGGVISGTHLIDNYPGIEEISGFEFSQKLVKHAQKYGTQIFSQKLTELIKKGNLFELTLEGGEKIKTKTVLLATGNKRRTLGVLNEEKYLGKGVSYCATCDGFFYKNKTVAVVGGNDSALGAASYLAEIAKKVYIIYRKKAFRAEPYWIKKIEKNKKIEAVFETNISAFQGEKKIEKIILDKKYKGKNLLEVDGIFIEIGADPDLGFAQKMPIETDEKGFVKVKSSGETNVPGLWAAGDLTDGSDKFQQVITAAAEGAIAARSIYTFLRNENA